jgi:hypothetical protein
MLRCTFSVPTSNLGRFNLAGGKRDKELLLPINSSLSATLHQDELHAKTSVACSSTFTEDAIWLNGIKEKISNERWVAHCGHTLHCDAPTPGFQSTN